MKAFLIGIIFLVIVGVGAYVGLKYFYKPTAGSQTFKTAVITKTGILQKSTIAQSDFTHVIVSSGASVGVASYTLNLDDYIGKNVSVTGQFSGDTLYADSITIIP
ncbi:MAG: hypothetical protein NT149_02140 [Candidatus Gottesmanbacteria bacterium]|nr:hypothetical protein [Candidatus Gottesmanbacteria bacterium]